MIEARTLLSESEWHVANDGAFRNVVKGSGCARVGGAPQGGRLSRHRCLVLLAGHVCMHGPAVWPQRLGSPRRVGAGRAVQPEKAPNLLISCC